MRAVTFATLILATLILLAEWSIFPKRFLLIFAFVSFILLFSIRLLKRTLLKQFRLHGSQSAFGRSDRSRTTRSKTCRIDQ